MSKKIIAVGIPLASDRVVAEQFDSKVSLLDWDIILFRPSIEEFSYSTTDTFKGRPSLSDYSSFGLKEASEHWRREIKQAIESGKTVIVFLPPLQEVYVDTGRREHSGSARNARTTRIFEIHSNYASLPIDLRPINASGKEMKLVAHSEVIGQYWASFGLISQYEVQLAADAPGVCLRTRSGEKPVGAIIRDVASTGALILLPSLDFVAEFNNDEEGDHEAHEANEDDDEDDDEEDDDDWSPAAKEFASRFVHAVVEIDRSLHATAEVTPEPDWATDPIYALTAEEALRSELLEAESQLEAAQKRKEDLHDSLRDAGKFRALLYEKGKGLERAIIDALKLLGFEAHSFKSGNSEFDVVFECAEGRLIGEAEGKDTKAINIDKLRQLMMNIQEDLQREEVNSPAKGILFGNGYRSSPPGERQPQFTEKCIASALTMNTGLVATSDLYKSIQYVANTDDQGYATACREVLVTAVGLVNLPIPPENASRASEVENGGAA